MYVVLEVYNGREIRYCKVFETIDLAISAANARLSPAGNPLRSNMFSFSDFDEILNLGYKARMDDPDYSSWVVISTSTGKLK